MNHKCMDIINFLKNNDEGSTNYRLCNNLVETMELSNKKLYFLNYDAYRELPIQKKI